MPSLKEMLAAKRPAPVAAPAAQPVRSSAPVLRPAAPALKAVSPTIKPTPTTPSVRALGDAKPEDGDVPFEFASEKPSEAARDWLHARQQPATTLGIWVEPGEDGMAWLAVESESDPGRLLLLHRLPLLNQKTAGAPF